MEKQLYTLAECSQITGLSRSLLYELMKKSENGEQGGIASVKVAERAG